MYVRLICSGDQSNLDPDSCHIEIEDDHTTQTLYIPLWVKSFSLELYERFVKRRKSTEAMIQLPENKSMREKEEQVWQELNSKRDDMQEFYQPLLTKTHLNKREYNDLEKFLDNLRKDRYKGDKYEEFNEKLKANKEDYERQKQEDDERQKQEYDEHDPPPTQKAA